MSQAAYIKKIQVSDDDGTTWYDIPATSPTLEIGGDVLDNTELATNEGYRSRIYGLSDFSCNADSNWIPLVANIPADNASGATALDKLRNAKLNRTQLLMRYLPEGDPQSYSGLQGLVVVETFSHAGEVGGVETCSISLQGNGPLSVTI